MDGDVVVLGAKGRFGRAAVSAFAGAGWGVRAFARSWAGADAADGVARVAGDALDPRALTAVAEGCAVIVNALNPPYTDWKAVLPRLSASVIHAAKATGATVMIPGNVYNYGQGMPERLLETTPHRPITVKGRLREEMERAYEGAGVRTVVLRGGDYIEREKTGNWFDSQIAAAIGKGRVLYPGPLDCVHAWAYLPDMARAMAALAAERGGFARFEEFGFPGYALTGRDLIGAMERVTGRTLRVKGMPWPMVRLGGLVVPMMREIAEMAYLWSMPHAIDGTKLAAALPAFAATPLDVALADALGVAQSN